MEVFSKPYLQKRKAATFWIASSVFIFFIIAHFSFSGAKIHFFLFGEKKKVEKSGGVRSFGIGGQSSAGIRQGGGQRIFRRLVDKKIMQKCCDIEKNVYLQAFWYIPQKYNK
jgi:hypothetical protein